MNPTLSTSPRRLPAMILIPLVLALTLTACGTKRSDVDNHYTVGRDGDSVRAREEKDVQVDYKDGAGATKEGSYHIMPGDFITPAARAAKPKPAAPAPPPAPK